MKKILLLIVALFAAYSANAAASKLYIIGNPAGGWSPTKGIELTQTESGVFTYSANFTETQWFGFADQLGANDNDWATLNAHRYAPSVNNATPVEGNNDMVYAKDAAWQIPAGQYSMTIDTNTNKLILGGEIVIVVDDLYLRFASNDYACEDTYKFSTTDKKVFTLNVAALAAQDGFKVGSSDWAISYTSENYDMVLNQVYSCVAGGMDNEMAMANDCENVTITFDLENETIKFDGAGDVPNPQVPELFLLGGMNNWTASEEYKLTYDATANTYTFVAPNGLSAAWKIANSDWTINYGISGDDTFELGTEFNAWFNGSDFPAVAGTDVKITLKYNSNSGFEGAQEASKIVVTAKTDAIDAVEAVAAEAPAVYYNLQGVRVSEPVAGNLYIVRQGDKVVKQIAR